MEVEQFAEIEMEFIDRVHSMVWCNVATVDRQQRPYSRILHPLWESSTGWVLTHRDSHKSKQKLSPWRITLVTYPAESYDAGHLVWRNDEVF